MAAPPMRLQITLRTNPHRIQFWTRCESLLHQCAGKIRIIVGLRRWGKSQLLLQAMVLLEFSLAEPLEPVLFACDSCLDFERCFKTQGLDMKVLTPSIHSHSHICSCRDLGLNILKHRNQAGDCGPMTYADSTKNSTYFFWFEGHSYLISRGFVCYVEEVEVSPYPVA
jgi:hypothetical protein